MKNKAGFVLKQTYIVFVNVVLLNFPVFPSFVNPYLSHQVSKHQHYNSKKTSPFDMRTLLNYGSCDSVYFYLF